jgi:hypothetical protein
MREFVIQIPAAMITVPTMMMATSIVSHIGICFKGFIILRLLAPA